MMRFARRRGMRALLVATALSTAAATAQAATPAQQRAARPPANARQAEAPRPNVLVIVADDLGFADVGFNGATFPTPNIDRIAKMGTKLDHFYVSALCSPTRAGLLTGRYPHRFGIMGDTITPGSDFGLDPREETLAQMFARAGYDRRSFIGKWHLGHRSPAFHPMSFGFTSFYGHYNGAIDYFTHKREGQVDWHRDRTPSADKGYSTDLMSDEAVSIIDKSKADKSPWFMWLAYNAPHGPLQAKEEDLLAAGFDPGKPRFGVRDSAGEGGELGRGNSQRQTVIAMIRAMDRGIGKVLDALERTGQLDNTLILFTSDNGGPGSMGPRAAANAQASNAPLRGFKNQHYEGGVRVAAAIAWPGHLKPRDQAGVGRIAYIDLMPTLAKLAGTTPSRQVDGQDVSAALLSGRQVPDRPLFLGENYSVRTFAWERGPTDPAMQRGRAAALTVGRWKLVGSQLFDIAADPSEKNDVAAQHPDVVKQLSAQAASYAAMRQVPRQKMNQANLPPIPLWELPAAGAAKN